MLSRLLLPMLAAACASGDGGLGSQPAIQTHLVVHVDPLSRTAGDPCEDPWLNKCGSPSLEPWKRRTNNLRWLAEEWTPAGRTVDLQLGPEAALAWAGHPETLAALGQGSESTAETGMCALEQLIGSGQASLGLHMHAELPDAELSHSEQTWGTLKLTARDDPCASTLDQPIEEVPARQAEALVHYGAASVHPIATQLGVDISSFTAHVPRSLATKIAVLEDPDGIDPATDRSFPDSFRPRTLSSAYAECYQHAVDHPPFEVYPTGGTVPLSVGQGPMVIPGNRVVGSMAPHLGQPSDGSVEAARRRLLQLLLNWRVSGLQGQADRPWVFTFHTHLFDLQPDLPDPEDSDARQLSPNEGSPYRRDLEALARTVDQLTHWPAWRGISGEEGVMEWSLPEDLSVAGSRFNLDPGNTYLPLVTERLAHGHLVCSRTRDGFDQFQIDRCPDGWSWGGTGFGQHCTDGWPPESVTVIVSELGGCAPGPDSGLRAAAVDAERMTAPMPCSGGLLVPPEGLIIERHDGRPWRPDLCTSGSQSVLQP
jgi:hypothetical protein